MLPGPPADPRLPQQPRPELPPWKPQVCCERTVTTIMDSRRTNGERLVKTYLPRLSISLVFRPTDEVPVTGVDFSVDGSSAREGGADPSAALWADPSLGTRGSGAEGAWPVSAAGRKARAAGPAPPTPPITGGGFPPLPPILKAPPINSGVETLVLFTTGSATSFPFLFRTRDGMVGSSVTSSSPTLSACGASSGSGG